MENQEQTNSETAAQPDLSVTDLTNIRSIIDVAVRRGAFGASEISGVGLAYDKLNAFLTAVAASKPEGSPE
jgi:hypothetical protein